MCQSSVCCWPLCLCMQCLTSSFFSLSISASFWLLMYSVSMRASCLRSSSSAASRPLYSASSKQASSTVFDSLSAASLSTVGPRRIVKVTDYDFYLHSFSKYKVLTLDLFNLSPVHSLSLFLLLNIFVSASPYLYYTCSFITCAYKSVIQIITTMCTSCTEYCCKLIKLTDCKKLTARNTWFE